MGSGKWVLIDSQLLEENGTPRKQRKMNAINYVFILIAGAAVASAGYYCKTGFDTPTCLLIEAAKLPSGPQAAPAVPVDCTLCQTRAIALRITDKSVYKPTCNGRRFAHQQYDDNKNQVFCVESNGQEIPGSRQKGKNGNCKKFPRKGAKQVKPQAAPAVKLCVRKRAQAARAKAAFVPVCKNGDFDVKQCAGNWCWCTSAGGDAVPYTFHKKGSAKAPNCAGHRAFKFSCTKKMLGTSQPHPTDCSRYIQCTEAGTFSCACVAGMKFDRKEGVCNFAKNVKCAKPAQKQQKQQQQQQKKQG